MKTKYNIMLLIPLIVLSTSACASSEEIIVKNNVVILNTEKCSIKINKKESKLALKNNCFFIKKSNSKDIRAEYYDDIKSYVLLVVGTAVKNNPDFPLTQSRNDCGSQIQAIKISDSSVVTLSKVMSDVITCAGIGVDEKEFWIMAH